ncbi:MAG TPA: hypothetical protein VG817_12465 [Gemmatimonadales bacterium]|nr:hypothetical protein [Gemmatimonadales bacterium]
MSYVLPFRLRVPSRDEHSLTEHTSISFKFRGLMRLEPDHLYIEWAGTGKVEEHGLLGNATDIRTLPLESIELPLDQIRLMRFLGGWWWPRIVLSAVTLDGLRVIPSEEDGVVRFYLARSDRATAEALVAAVMQGRGA